MDDASKVARLPPAQRHVILTALRIGTEPETQLLTDWIARAAATPRALSPAVQLARLILQRHPGKDF